LAETGRIQTTSPLTPQPSRSPSGRLRR
jgi:hypothetical protein